MRRRSFGVSLALGPKPAMHVRREHEEQRADGDQEHDGEDAESFREQIAVPVQRAGEVEPEHSRAPVWAERLWSDERCEERERAADDEHVVAVRDEVRGDDVVREHGEGDRGERRQVCDRERDRRQHLVSGAAPEPENPPHREEGQRDDRPRRTLAGSVVGAITQVEEPRVLSGCHVPPPM